MKEIDHYLFDMWNIEKKKINSSRNKFYINERQIWFTKMGINIGCEENGKENFSRPVLVTKKVGSLFFTVALTTKEKTGIFYYKIEDASFVILSQVKVMDKNRFERKIDKIEGNKFEIIKQKITELIL